MLVKWDCSRLVSLIRNYEVQPFGPENVAIVKGLFYTPALLNFGYYVLVWWICLSLVN